MTRRFLTGLAGLALVALLLPALALTLARATGSGAGLLVRAASFAPLALPAYAAALALVLVLLLAPGGRGRARLLVAGLVAIAGLGVHSWWLAPQYVGAAPAPAPGAETLTVMTSNLYEGRGDVGTVVETVRADGVDVLVLVEVSARALAAADAAGLAELLPFRIGGPDGTDPISGTMVLAREPMGAPTPVETYHQSWLVDVGDLRVLAVHPVAPVDPELWRTDHATLLAVAREARPDLALGDFNATADHRPMRDLAAAGLRDVGELADEGWQPTWPANGISPLPGVPLPPLVRIDHVLVGDALAGLGSRTVEVPGSDHLAVVAEVARR